MALRQLAQKARLSWGLAVQAAPAACTSTARFFASVLPDLKYAASHEWAKVEGGVATVGISDHAQAELGDVVYVELPEVGASVTKGQPFGVVESVKAASDVYAPVSGEVVEINSVLKEESGKVNAEPYGSGWMIKVKLSDSSELSDLLDAKAYEAHSTH